MAMKSVLLNSKTSDTILSTVNDLMAESRQLKETLLQQQISPTQRRPQSAEPLLGDYNTEEQTRSNYDKQKIPFNSKLQVPKTTKMTNTSKDSILLQETSMQTPKLSISKSQDDAESIAEECVERYCSVSPISFYGQHQQQTAQRGPISSTGASRALNFRSKFRKSHTCGSLFAKCNCGAPPEYIETIQFTKTAAASPFTAAPSSASSSQFYQSSRAISVDSNNVATSLAAATTTTTIVSIHEQPSAYTSSSSSSQAALHLSISPPPSHSELSMASSANSARLTSSGIYSLSNQTSSATSAYLSRDESLSYSFDTQMLSPSSEQQPAITATQAQQQQQPHHPHSIESYKNITPSSSTPAKQIVSQDGDVIAQTTNSTPVLIPRISSPVFETPKPIAGTSPTPSTRRSEVTQKFINSSGKKLFQSYSHPDTDFIFTDANKHPSKESVLHAHALQPYDTVITSRGGKVEIKQPKRSSSPNIGQYQVLDVAVHPDILVKISPRHSPICEARQPHSSLSTKSAQARRRLLQRSHEIDSGGSTSESEKSVDAKSSSDVSTSTQTVLLKSAATSPLLSPTKTRQDLLEDQNFDKAQRYFAESGILGPIHTTSNLIRKTSKILQDSHVIEQIRKTSMILRSNNQSNNGSQAAATNLIKNASSLNNTTAATSATAANVPLKLHLNTNMNAYAASSSGNQATQSLNYSPGSPQSPHTMATKCGFSPNVTTQSCIVVDDKDAQIKSLQGEIVSLKDVIKSRDAEIVKLRREIHKLKSVLQQTTNHIPLAHDELLQPPSPTIHAINRCFMPLQCSDVSSSQEHLCEHCKKALENRIPTTIVEQPNAEAKITPDSNGSSLDSSISEQYQSCNSRSASTGNTSETWAPAQGDKALECNKTQTTQANTLNNPSAQVGNTNTSNTTTAIFKSTQPVLKKQGVSGESCETSMNQSFSVPIPKYDKDFRSKQLIKDAIMDNDFLKNIDASQVRELVDSMYSLTLAKDKFVIREGEVGAHLYVSAEGEFEVEKNGKVLGIMGPGKAFGELAILYNCTRTASVKVLSDARVWVLDRRIFQQIMMRTGLQRIENSVNFLKSVPLLKNLSDEVLAKIADVLEVEFYPAGTYIIRQGATGDTFFLISQGTVKVTQKLSPSIDEKEIRTLERGDYFGEQALINEDKRTANIIAMAPGVECLTLDRESFTHLIGDLCELKEKNYGDENRVLAMKFAEKTKEVFGTNLKQEFPDLKLTDMEVVATLGIGGFGRVELVKAYQKNSVDIFALKCLKKRHIVDTKQEEHIFSERNIMLTCNSPFICRLYRTFRDEKYVYMMLEACMGGEIWTMLRDRGCFDDNAAQFIIGCVLQAFEYLHSRGIIYRDLKPENLMLDERGYVKLVDFGFAKYIGNSSKTWTFCGTPEYVAPEIILNKGHDRAVDYWALGILIHELLNGTPPFTANDPMKTYNIILKGIDMIDFPKHISRPAVMLIKKLCRDVPTERLGYQKGGIQDIKKHKWFLGFDWDGLQSQLLIPPFVRPIAHPTDTTYFDKFPCDLNEPPDEFSGWDADF